MNAGDSEDTKMGTLRLGDTDRNQNKQNEERLLCFDRNEDDDHDNDDNHNNTDTT